MTHLKKNFGWKLILKIILRKLEKKIKLKGTYKFPSSTGSMNNQVGHVSNDIGCQSKVEEHVEDVE